MAFAKYLHSIPFTRHHGQSSLANHNCWEHCSQRSRTSSKARQQAGSHPHPCCLSKLSRQGGHRSQSQLSVVAKENLAPGSDGAGTVEEAGPNSIWKKGDRVIIQPSEWTSGYDERDFEIDTVLGGGEVDGTFRRWIVSNDSNLFKAPDALTFEEACTVHTAGVTAFRSLFHGGVELQPGTTVLTQGTGGVSCYAIMVSGSITLDRSRLTRPR